jgi:hypothetical protein
MNIKLMANKHNISDQFEFMPPTLYSVLGALCGVREDFGQVKLRFGALKCGLREDFRLYVRRSGTFQGVKGTRTGFWCELREVFAQL